MKVLHIIGTLGQGGAETVLYRLATTNVDATHTVAAFNAQDFYQPKLLDSGIRAIDLGMGEGKLTLGGLIGLYRLVREVRPDVVQTWMYHADALGGMVARLAGVRSIVWGIRTTGADRNNSSIATRIAARVCIALSYVLPVKIVACAQAAADYHRELGYAKKKLVVIPNGYDIQATRRDATAADAVRQELGIAASTRVFGLICRWHPVKNHAGLLKTLSALRKSVPFEWKLVLAGNGVTTDNQDLLELIERYDLQEHVLPLGLRSDVPALMSMIDLYILPSLNEGFPNALAEAMACETPCVATDVGDSGYIVDDTGWVVPPNDLDALRDALLQAFAEMQSDDMWHQRGHRSRARIAKNFSLESMSSHYTTVWKSVLQDNHA